MAQNSSPWDGISVGDAANAPYSSNEWAHLWALLQGAGSTFPNYGILLGSGDGTYDPLQVIASGGSNIDVKVGAALVNGKLYETDAAITMAVGANASGNPRIDTVVLRTDYVAQTIRPVIVQGTPAASPVRPTLTQNTTLWEMPLADIAVANGFSTISVLDIKDRRRVAKHSGAGWQLSAHGLDYIPNNAYNSNLQAITSFAIPFAISGNMLVERIAFVAGTTGDHFISWGIYIEDLNDENSNENVLRAIGGRLNAALSPATSISVGSVALITAAPAPVFLVPGSYWLVVADQSNLAMPSVAPTGLDANNNKAYVGNVVSLGQTINLETGGWTASPLSFGVRLDGRVFGNTTVV